MTVQQKQKKIFLNYSFIFRYEWGKNIFMVAFLSKTFPYN